MPKPCSSHGLVRAKTKIRDDGIQFEVRQERQLPQRLDAVLEAIYAAFGESRLPRTLSTRGRDSVGTR